MDVGGGVLSAAVLLFFVMDPFGNVPLFLTLLKDVDPQRRRKVLLRELTIALGVLLFFLFLGGSILDFLGLSQVAMFAVIVSILGLIVGTVMGAIASLVYNLLVRVFGGFQLGFTN